MVLPLFKVISLVTRVFSKPLIQYAKQASQSGEFKHKQSRKFFIFIGKKYNKYETKINQKLLNNTPDDYFVKMNWHWIKEQISFLKLFYTVSLQDYLVMNFIKLKQKNKINK